MSPGGENTTIEEYIVTPASDLISKKESARDCIKLYGPNQAGVSMVAQPYSGQGSMLSRSTLTLSRQGSIVAQVATLKDPIVNLFGSMHENAPPELGTSRNMLMGESDQSSPYGTSENLNAPLLATQGSTLERDKALGDVPKNNDIGGGWKLVYKSGEGGKKELQRVYLRADTNGVSRQGSFGSGYDMHRDGSEAFQAAALVSQSVLSTKDVRVRQEVEVKRCPWAGLLDIGVRRALVVGVGLQLLQQVNQNPGYIMNMFG